MKFKISDKTVFAWHSWLGLIVGLFSLFLSITGILLLFSDEIDAALSPELLNVQPAPKRFPADSMLSTLQHTYPQAVLIETHLNTSHPGRAVVTELILDGESQLVYWNPYTNQLNGLRKKEDVWKNSILEWHEELTAGDVGHVFLFIVGLALLGSVLTGVWYYRKSLLKVFTVGVRRKNTYLFNADLHKLTGVISCLFLVLMAGTGTFFHWEKIERMMGEEGEQPREVKADFSAPVLSKVKFSLDGLLRDAAQNVPDFLPEHIQYPRTEASVVVSGTHSKSIRLLGEFNTRVVFDTGSSQFKEVIHQEDGDMEQMMEKSFEQLHYGQYGGLWSKIIYALGGLCLSALSLTGFVIWLKKK
ncbi:PepSY-associated TM helix domain-containing protein [Runella slithyformis]|uniref:PepSY-associated TM helix domain protein n=1 Tax=Runella slithyformis (strain ATCC 29530 / DSM 19594 / LMG 11500 / NCIMB 11436 / LSU 4) TaxID=761193 RepID=A0A7U4E8L2_RUNSL|nr:PepSY-associated TM helix domain-containing protein [Runella slithyformis]AEI51828.1 PepSY-associated TM helix domain protein [Runella slithyformis DSM 19594]